ncbi:hypothetical protein A6R68_19715, partial [Neotoma lepida]
PRTNGCGWEGSNSDILSYTNQKRNPSIASDHGYCRSLSKGSGEKQKLSMSCGEEPNGGGWEWSNSDVMNYLNWERNPFTALDRGFCGSLSRAS